MKKRKKLNGIEIRQCSFDKKGRLILGKRIFFKEKKRDPNEVVKVIVMPDGDIWLYDKELYGALLNSRLWFHPKPQIKEMTWGEYEKKKEEMEMKPIKELRRILISQKKAEETLKNDKIKFGFACCS